MRESETIETPSGKGAKDENFPVASRFLRPEDRPLVMAYYAFARAADDIADNPELSPEDKTARLERFQAGLEGRERNEALATANRLGLLDLHGEDRALYPGANALCSALQVLNHLQDLRSDYLGLGRIYLPEDWMVDEKVEPRDLASSSASAGLRRVIDDCLWRSDSLLAQAEGLLAGLQSRRLLVQAATTHRLAETLLQRLLRRDPLARPVKLTRMDFLLAGAHGLLWGGLAR